MSVIEELKEWLSKYTNQKELAKNAEYLDQNLVPWVNGISYMARSVLIKIEELEAYDEERIRIALSAIEELEAREVISEFVKPTN